MKKVIWFIKAFTLLELLISVTIFLILGSISYFHITGFIKNSRDVVRLENLKIIDKSISLFKIQRGFFPKPDNSVEINYSGSLLWEQGVFGDNNFRQIDLINKKPTDIISNNEFSYSLSNNGKEYELGALTEGTDINQFTFISNTFASGKKSGISLVLGNYNGRILKTQSGSNTYLFSIPTIISRNIGDNNINSIINNQELAYKGYGNLPASYSGTIFKIDGGFDFNPNMFVLFSGSLDDILYNESTRITILKNFQNSYSGTILVDKKGIKEIIDLEINKESPSKQLKEISYDIFTNDLNIELPIIVESGDNWLSYDMSNLLIDSDTRDITQDSNLDFWFATKNGVSKFSNGDWIIYNEEDGLANVDTRAIIEDKDLFIWFATNKGISKFDNIDTWITYDDKSGLIDNDVVAIEEDIDGNLWFATKKGVSMFDGTFWTNFSQDKSGLINKIVTSIVSDLSNNIWFGTIDGVSMFDGINWITYSESDGLINKSILSMFVDSLNNIWFGTINGISMFDGINWIDLLVDKRVQVIFQDLDGIMWFGTAKGLSKFDGVNWIHYDINNGLVDNDVQSIYQDNDGNLWVGTKKGVTIFYK